MIDDITYDDRFTEHGNRQTATTPNTVIMHQREEAVKALIDSLQRSFAAERGGGFQIHPDLAFVGDGRHHAGIGARVSSSIPKNEVLLVIPDSIRFGTSRIPNDELIGLESILQQVKSKTALLYEESKSNPIFQYAHICPEEVTLAVLVMRAKAAAAASSTNTGWGMQVATWPSLEEVQRTAMPYWTEDQIHSVLGGGGRRGCAPRLGVTNHQALLRHMFENVIHPSLSHISDHFIMPSLRLNNNKPGDSMKTTDDKRLQLWESFRYALVIAYSRSHDGDGCGGGKPELLPLVELINGGPGPAEEDAAATSTSSTIINVGITRGQYSNNCNLSCSAVYALRDIDAGEELIISYGELNPSQFLLKYSTIPRSMVDQTPTSPSVVTIDALYIWCPPDLIPDRSIDPDRVKALEQNNYPLDDMRSGTMWLAALNAEAYNEYKNGTESRHLKCLRQFLILAHLIGDEAVRVNIATGRLRFNFSSPQLGCLICKVLDYNVELLDSGAATTSAEDVDRANNGDTGNPEATMLMARACQREALAVWRHLFGRKFKYPSHADPPSSSSNILMQSMGFGATLSPPPASLIAHGACRVCGRTYPIPRSCTRCKRRGADIVAKYCSREHQKFDWKVHKLDCTADEQ